MLLLVSTDVSANASISYTYDQRGRLASVTYVNGTTITYSYDNAGNRTSRVTVVSN
ncbi:RHS repeat domain-containing protein [Tardiphaga sp.]|uniref:RHS repeat domain-containing protein n=1 Tax=Tardiphaga sp. TaxID=1926292 RepID=UPI0037D9996F